MARAVEVAEVADSETAAALAVLSVAAAVELVAEVLGAVKVPFPDVELTARDPKPICTLS